MNRCMPDICFYTGASTAFNVERTLLNVGWMLSDEFELSLVSTSPSEFNPEMNDYFELHGGSGGDSLSDEFHVLSSFLGEGNPSALVQVTKPPRHGTIAGVLARRHNVPLVYRYSGDRFGVYRVIRGWRKPANFCVNNLVGRLPLLLADRFVTLGPRGSKQLTRRGVDPARVKVLPPPVDADRLRTPVPVDIDVPENRSVVLFVGRVSRLKGAQFLLDTIPDLLERREDLHFVFVGKTEEGLSIPSGYSDHVTMEGSVSPDLVPGYYQTADLLVLPSLSEGLPRVLLESLAVGTPVVARDVGEVSSVTTNTFTSRDEFLELVSGFEGLRVDDVRGFTREELEEDYLSFFREVC